ncbi:hypothetical protein GGS23DRAFT_520811 [Durotheca rogersii]|uniref:uncharacterized protein n=1 Tax=Durotheca rogersii TaxID=419775 RepID=UPI002220E070|nr:uncharacterized protein GGS23DRAFT_520811 [Durotheca rogersii]KAI5863927.1 hypothetical protein GGS23DRAFT_520811 [Durotheca rogersii]
MKTGWKSKNCARYDPRRIIEKGRLRAVQCRSPPLKTLILERRFSVQGKYEEEEEGKKEKQKSWSGKRILIPFFKGGERGNNQLGRQNSSSLLALWVIYYVIRSLLAARYLSSRYSWRSQTRLQRSRTSPTPSASRYYTAPPPSAGMSPLEEPRVKGCISSGCTYLGIRAMSRHGNRRLGLSRSRSAPESYRQENSPVSYGASDGQAISLSSKPTTTSRGRTPRKLPALWYPTPWSSTQAHETWLFISRPPSRSLLDIRPLPTASCMTCC